MAKISIKLLFTAFLVVAEFFAIPRSRTESEAKAFAENLYERIMQGESFKTLASLYCEDIEAAKNGGQKEFKTSELNKDLKKIVSNKEINQITKPFKINKAYYIIEVLEKSKKTIKIRYILISFS